MVGFLSLKNQDEAFDEIFSHKCLFPELYHSVKDSLETSMSVM